MAAPATDPPKQKRLADALMTRGDIGVAELRELLNNAEELQRQGKITEAVAEFVKAAQFYLMRAQPGKAAQVLRRAAQLQPNSTDVQIQLAETLMQMKLPEDAAAAFQKAAANLHKDGKTSEWLDVVRRMTLLDPDDLHGRLQVAEALSRAGKRDDAAEMFRSLASDLLSRSETDDWEKVAERLAHHAPDDTTTHHDLALHYVRSGRFVLALPKLIACYEAGHRDAELLELVVETLESLGQREKAAAICRQLLLSYRKTSLRAEAERTLERLYHLDPDDPEARTYVGALQPAIEGGTVIDFEAGPLPARRAASAAHQASPRQESAGFELPPPAAPHHPSQLIPKPGQRISSPPAQPVKQVSGAQPVRPASQPSSGFRAVTKAAAPPRPFAQAQAVAPVRSSAPPVPDDDEFDAATVAVASPPVLQRAISPPVPQAPPPRQATPAFARAAAQPPPQPAPRAVPEPVPANPATNSIGRLPAVAALEALATIDDAPEPDHHDELPADDEAGFEAVEERTLVEGPPGHQAAGPEPAAPRAAAAPALMMPKVAAQPPPAAAAPSAMQPVVSARQRSNSLPRPRLARRAGTVSELPTAVRDMTKDVNTLEFFIERGFYDSAVALLDELQKRHPDSVQLRAYRNRIDKMQRA